MNTSRERLTQGELERLGEENAKLHTALKQTAHARELLKPKVTVPGTLAGPCEYARATGEPTK